MKKLLTLSMMLMVAVLAQAQLKVFPALKKGLEKVYVSNGTVSLPGQTDMVLTTETKYTVSDATADGYIIDMVTTSVSSTATAQNITGKLLQASQEMVKGLVIRVATDKNGKLVKIANYDELSKAIEKSCQVLINKLYEMQPEIKDALPEEALKSQFKESVTEEALLNGLKSTSSPLMLFGKTIMTGAQEDALNESGMKMKRMYFVNGRSVTSNATLNMTKEDIKKLILAQVEKMAPEQADMMKESIDQLMDSGMLKIEAKETATYELADDNWPKKMEVEVVNESAGQKNVSKTTTILK